MKCSVKQRGKFFIVVDPFHHKSYTLNNRLGAESLEGTLNKLHKENRKLKNELKLSKLQLNESDGAFNKLHKMYMGQIEEINELKDKCDFMERVIINKGYSIEYDVEKGRWVIE